MEGSMLNVLIRLEYCCSFFFIILSLMEISFAAWALFSNSFFHLLLKFSSAIFFFSYSLFYFFYSCFLWVPFTLLQHFLFFYTYFSFNSAIFFYASIIYILTSFAISYFSSLCISMAFLRLILWLITYLFDFNFFFSSFLLFRLISCERKLR